MAQLFSEGSVAKLIFLPQVRSLGHFCLGKPCCRATEQTGSERGDSLPQLVMQAKLVQYLAMRQATVIPSTHIPFHQQQQIPHSTNNMGCRHCYVLLPKAGAYLAWSCTQAQSKILIKLMIYFFSCLQWQKYFSMSSVSTTVQPVKAQTIPHMLLCKPKIPIYCYNYMSVMKSINGLLAYFLS